MISSESNSETNGDKLLLCSFECIFNKQLLHLRIHTIMIEVIILKRHPLLVF